ncbi:hypothetical protein VC83_06053 [Pseudogymnoascus destructans]|uniref:Glutathione S-transferase UstS-like C-terminal domain-containing protein n=1 Tax=Pseudogymnoascus destructans TaxID=655981 RepID=A0A177A7N0_9PEZI|nr:uncharacterized protein VC83_06053 [Pseudogymnoascus destructans]OAF57153.1 hypothetical protein VC83_06053 [Pseudogymnoascus destructans]
MARDKPLTRPIGLISGESPTREKHNVPAIHHLPTNTHIIDSTPIAKFLEAHTPPHPPSNLLARRHHRVTGTLCRRPKFRASVVPREINILSLRSQEYFRRTREAALGRKLEDCLMRRRRAGRLSVRE